MTARRTAAGILAATIILGAASAGPATAADTALTLTLVNTGTLSITAPASASTSREVATSGDATLNVGGVTISDGRVIRGAFTATATSTNLTSGATSIANSTMRWTTDTITDGSGGPTTLVGPGGNLDSPAVIATGPGFGIGQATYIVNGHITIPIGNRTSGDYTGTLTVSVS